MEDKKKIAVLGVIFPAVGKFIDDYLTSLEKQTYRDFDVVIINDGFGDFGSTAHKYRLNIKEIQHSGSVAKNREHGINYVKKTGYECVVFADSDDYFASDRVGKSVELLGRYDIVVNDFTTVSVDGGVLERLYLSNRLKNLSKIDFGFIVDKNIFGFSNTSMRLRCLKNSVDFDEDLIAVDWNLYAALLKKGRNAIFTNETETFYRIYEGNTIGVSPLNAKKIERGVSAKYLHYKMLSEKDKNYEGLYAGFSRLKKDIVDDRYKKNYISKIRSTRIDKPLWWEEIRLPEKLKDENKIDRR